MTKSATTIRRRKTKYNQDDFNRMKNSFPQTHKVRDEGPKKLSEEEEGYLFDDEVLGPSIVKKLMNSEKSLLLALISVRVVNSLIIQTYFVPDEFWQSLEVAHNTVFGYGYMTWEWQNGLRGYLYPSIFAVLYKLQALFGLDNRLLLIKLPRMVQGVIAAFGDLYIYKLSASLSGRATAQWTLLCQILSWFMLYCSTRTLTNSTETVLCTIALYYFPWPGKYSSGSTKKFLMFAALSVLVRPTAAVIWILLCSWHLQNNSHRIVKTLKAYILVSIISLSVSSSIDRLFYGKWIFVQYNFLHFNVLSGGGSFYGTHPWHWYLTQGYPVVMGTHIVPFVFGAWKAKNKVLLFVILWTIFIYSFLSHKEFRFLMPIMPLSFHYCGVYFQSLCKKPRLKKGQARKACAAARKDHFYGSEESLVSSLDESESTTSTVNTELSTEISVASTDTSGISSEGDNSRCSEKGSDSKLSEKGSDSKLSEKEEINSKTKTDIEGLECKNDGEERGEMNIEIDESLTESVKKSDMSTNEILAAMKQKQHDSHRGNLTKAKIFVIILVLTNIPMAVYFGLIHQRGTISVMKYIYDASQEKAVDVLFLMPCHSTPYYSYIHRNISMRFLTCEPNLSHIDNYLDEADVFYKDPVQWLKKEYSATSRPWPTHLVYFNPLQSEISSFLTQSGYRDCRSVFHTHLPEGRVGTHVLVSCR